MGGQLFALLLGASNVILAVGVFIVMARPERALGFLCHLAGLGEIWRSGRLSEADETRLLILAHQLRWPMLILLFGWSFVCGAVLTWSRL